MATFVRSVLLTALCVLLIPAVSEAQQTINFVSDSSWTVTDASSATVGNSVFVCLNASSPSPCPAGAVQWGWGGSGWSQSLASIPGAGWIWAPGLTGASSAALERYTFTRTFVLNGTPLSGTIFMTADDYVEVRVNGTLVGSVGSTSNAGSSGAGQALQSFNILSNLVVGSNTIAVTAQNGPVSFGGATYATNPAGAVFGGTLTAAAAVPTMGEYLTLTLTLFVAALAVWHLRRRRFLPI